MASDIAAYRSIFCPMRPFVRQTGAIIGGLGCSRQVSLGRAPACASWASGGYPGAFEKGKAIHGIEDAEATGASVFQAGNADGLERLGKRPADAF